MRTSSVQAAGVCPTLRPGSVDAVTDLDLPTREQMYRAMVYRVRDWNDKYARDLDPWEMRDAHTPVGHNRFVIITFYNKNTGVEIHVPFVAVL